MSSRFGKQGPMYAGNTDFRSKFDEKVVNSAEDAASTVENTAKKVMYGPKKSTAGKAKAKKFAKGSALNNGYGG